MCVISSKRACISLGTFCDVLRLGMAASLRYLLPGITFLLIRQGSNALDRCSAPERSSAVMLSAAKHLCARRARCFASLSMTMWDGSPCQVHFGRIVPCLTVAHGCCHFNL